MSVETYREARARYIEERAKGKAGNWVLVWSPGDGCHKMVKLKEMEADPGAVGCSGGHVVLSLSPRRAKALLGQRELGWGERWM